MRPTMRPLTEDFADSLRAGVINLERQQILDMLATAEHVAVPSSLVADVFKALDRAPATLERNLDCVRMPSTKTSGQPVWIEIDDPRRQATPDTASPARFGFLLSPHPDDPDVLVVAVARQIPERAGGVCHLMPALCAISLPVLADLSKNARRLRKGQSQSLTRIARCLRPYIPTGFVPEFETLAKVTHNFDLPSIERQSLAETSAQILYLLGLLLALQADNVELRRSEDTTAATAHLTTPSSNWLKRVLGAANLTDTAGFVRGFDDGRPTVTLRPAKAA